MSAGEDQYLHLSFSPHIDQNTIMYYSGDIIQVLYEITRIDHQFFEYVSSTALSVVEETYYQGTWRIENNLQTRAKILSLKEMLDYDDGERFKTIFNIWLEWNNEIYVIDVSGLDSIVSQSGVLGLKIQPEWDIDNVLGFGVLHTMDPITGSMRMFCPNKVCASLDVVPSSGTTNFKCCFITPGTVGMDGKPSRLPNGVSILLC